MTDTVEIVKELSMNNIKCIIEWNKEEKYWLAFLGYKDSNKHLDEEKLVSLFSRFKIRKVPNMMGFATNYDGDRNIGPGEDAKILDSTLWNIQNVTMVITSCAVRMQH